MARVRDLFKHTLTSSLMFYYTFSSVYIHPRAHLFTIIAGDLIRNFMFLCELLHLLQTAVVCPNTRVCVIDAFEWDCD